jgi:hypothetical protein
MYIEKGWSLYEKYSIQTTILWSLCAFIWFKHTEKILLQKTTLYLQQHFYGISHWILPTFKLYLLIIQGLSELADQNNTVKSSSSGNNRKNI